MHTSLWLHCAHYGYRTSCTARRRTPPTSSRVGNGVRVRRIRSCCRVTAVGRCTGMEVEAISLLMPLLRDPRFMVRTNHCDKLCLGYPAADIQLIGAASARQLPGVHTRAQCTLCVSQWPLPAVSVAAYDSALCNCCCLAVKLCQSWAAMLCLHSTICLALSRCVLQSNSVVARWMSRYTM